MSKIKIKLLFATSMFLVTMLLCGCGKENNGYNLDYLAVQMSKGDSWSIIDKDGNVVVKEEYSEDSKISEIHHGAYWVKSGEKYQLYNIKEPKKPVTDEEFTSVTPFYSGVAVVSNPNEQIRIIDTDGKTVATLGKEIKRCFSISKDGYGIFCNKENKNGIINNKGNIIIQPEYFVIYACGEGLVVAQKNKDDKALLILDMNGQKQGEIDTKKYEVWCVNISEGKIVVRDAQDESCVVLDKTGKKLFGIKKSTAVLYECYYYSNGYLVFDNPDGKNGVANDKGEIVIRPKYEGIMNNLGDGLFFARKGDKWGIIDAEDNTIVDFDYDKAILRMGENFLMQDGDTYSLVNKEGKEIASFDDMDKENNGFVEYVDLESLSSSLYNNLEEIESAKPISQAVKTIFKDLDLSGAGYTRYVTHRIRVEEKIEAVLEITYDNVLAEEEFHTEKVDDGWFTYERNISDGWHWTNAIPMRISGKISLMYDAGINISDFYNSLLPKISKGRTKIDENKFSKVVNTAGQKLECITDLSLDGNSIDLDIVFRK